jgi:choline dehydrogenase-like flavoprotein
MPLIDPGMLNSAFDVQAFMESFKSASRFFGAPAWSDFVLNITGPIASATTDDELEEVIRASVFPSGHIVGTAAMSAKHADHGVVDPDLKLKHVSGLRVVDASVMVSTAPRGSFVAILTIVTAIRYRWTYTSACLYYRREGG